MNGARHRDGRVRALHRARVGAAIAALAALAALAGCASLNAPPVAAGADESQVRARLGTPTARYPMPGGATRLEYASGPYGRTTWMIDLDAAGRVTAATQVLGEASFDALQRRAPGMSVDELLRTLGRPGERRSGGYQGGEIWSWRYPTNDCLWFQVSIGDDRKVRDGAYGIDPRCDPPSDRD